MSGRVERRHPMDPESDAECLPAGSHTWAAPLVPNDYLAPRRHAAK